MSRRPAPAPTTHTRGLLAAGAFLAACTVVLAPSMASAATVPSAVSAVVVPAGGSDSPTPYTVTAAGITLPDGMTFQAHGHVNIHTTLGDRSIHFDPNNNQPGGAWIGKSFIPWSAFGLEGSFCVTWVQIGGFNEHFGEGGQDPVCVDPTPDPEPTPEVTP
ncbi:MAG TPA: hypothetical protein VNR62_03815, partial [Cellulomonas sp.]|nr:hypothetical protein [Cellulomonas sp.]